MISIILSVKVLCRLLSCVMVTAGALAANAAQGQITLPGPVSQDYFGLVMYRADASQPWPGMRFGA